MTTLLVTARQLEALDAAAAGLLARDSTDPNAAWRIDGGPACSVSAWCLLDRGLITEAPAPLPDGRVPAVIAPAGTEIRTDLASRAPTAGAR